MGPFNWGGALPISALSLLWLGVKEEKGQFFVEITYETSWATFYFGDSNKLVRLQKIPNQKLIKISLL